VRRALRQLRHRAVLLARPRLRPDAALLGPLPAAEPDVRLRLAVAGDVGHPSSHLDATVDAIAASAAARPFDGLLLLGDNVYPDGDPALVPAAVLRPFAPVLEPGVPLLAVLGNHDVQSGRGDEVARRLGLPGRWYARELGDVRVVALDSTQPDDAEQLAWLAATLAAPWPGWTVVALHHPPWSAGWHGPDPDVGRTLWPVLRRFDVDLVLSGHEHDYQRSVPLDGTTYVVTGAATHLRPTARGEGTATAWSVRHFVDLRVVGEHLVLRAVDQTGLVFDGVSLPRRLAPVR
jgi:3',5'-cyclic AMP phosphodiesterase CpdA